MRVPFTSNPVKVTAPEVILMILFLPTSPFAMAVSLSVRAGSDNVFVPTANAWPAPATSSPFALVYKTCQLAPALGMLSTSNTYFCSPRLLASDLLEKTSYLYFQALTLIAAVPVTSLNLIEPVPVPVSVPSPVPVLSPSPKPVSVPSPVSTGAVPKRITSVVPAVTFM